ncbi:CDP-glucose 4,6-dehydratase [Lutimonas halocynthiae]|uniref:CDP-glucose 4,6-dehydratase n=1 Tax=Lutimonas halocynthiae TaxID=1446477 RepID=UPI0025B4EFBE|nr:CDP-glucose 4,6-dehydratase [Lutimonas halocynthiae]MDN3643374.1 CDP-glucose 4,6-dehydratase [Lutimonas halocynthiae]
MINFECYKDKKVLVTGHTGFKGSWMSQWLLQLNADVYGYALQPSTTPSLYDQLGLEDRMTNKIGDIRDLDMLKQYIASIEPDIIFHLAAQPLVRDSYLDPVYTWETNVNGTMNVMEAVRQLGLETNIVVITSDKCYENKEWIFGYRENDALGGYDPYSASKGAAEIVVSSWRRSFFNPKEFKNHKVKLSSARAGNVIGGGDWAKDRIIPDCVRALMKSEEIQVRNPLSTRPWQHVLESLGGYLLLGRSLLISPESENDKLCGAFNFGPYGTSNKPVEALVNEVLEHWNGSWNYKKEDAFHEAFLLNLNIDKATQTIGWSPVWNFKETIENTISWYKLISENPELALEVTNKQIEKYSHTFIENLNG